MSEQTGLRFIKVFIDACLRITGLVTISFIIIQVLLSIIGV